MKKVSYQQAECGLDEVRGGNDFDSCPCLGGLGQPRQDSYCTEKFDSNLLKSSMKMVVIFYTGGTPTSPRGYSKLNMR